MRPGLAEGPSRPRSKALVLGPRCVAELIANDLRLLGFEPVLESEITGPKLPSPAASDPNADEKLRSLLAHFLDLAGPSSSSYAHLVHPGTSFWADRSELSMIGQQLGLSVICPPARVMSLFGNKLNLLAEAEKLGIPNLVVSYDPIYSVREVEASLEKTTKRFPFVLKSSRGGSSFGLLVLHQPEDLAHKLPLWIEQLRRNAGEVILFPERYIEGARHITVPFARLMNGETRCFPMVDSSLQCRHRKVVEFCPALGLEAAMVQQLQAWTLSLAEKTGFYGVGSLEFLVDGSRAFLTEGVPRLNTAFHLWEKVAGTSAVAWQLAAMAVTNERSSRGLPLRPEREWAHAIALRFYSEDSLLQLPQPGAGVVHELSAHRERRFPGAAAEFVSSVSQGTEIGFQDDGMLGLLFVGAQERKQATTVARGMLDELWIAGSLQTNERFLSELVFHPWVREGIFHAGFIDEEFIPELRPAPELMKLFASVCASLVPSGKDFRIAVGDQWVKPDLAAVKWVDKPSVWSLGGNPGVSGTLEISDGRKLRACAFPITADRWQVRVGAWTLAVRKLPAASGGRKPVERKLMSLVNGRVHSLLYRESSSIPAHEPLVVIESLRMLVPHALPTDSRITRWKVAAEEIVHAGQELASFELVSSTKD
jgi:acetyl/propionyl-CoA carboxylase alpha subunit